MELKPGLKLKSAASTAEFIVIRSPGGDLALTCAGAPLTPDGSVAAQPQAPADEILIGKRYSDDDGTIELLCTRGGPGPLMLDGRLLGAVAAKSLPSSD